MKSIKLKSYLLSLLTLTMFLFSSCDDDDEETPVAIAIVASDFTATIGENPANGASLGTVSASVNDNSALTYALATQSVSNAMAINPNTGELTVADSAAFDFEANPTLTATYTASSGSVQETGSIIITLTNLIDVGFITTWQTTTANESINIPINSNIIGYDYTVDWGDGSEEAGLTGDATHSYATAGTHTVTITGDYPAINMGNSDVSNNSKLVDIKQWGEIEWKSMDGAFEDCSNLGYSASDAPNLSEVTALSSTFRNSGFNGNINNWDISSIELMRAVFFDAASFNQPLENWDMSNVNRIENMFQGASDFNQPIGNWDMSNVTNMSQMFYRASSFNQPLNDWEVGNVTAMRYVFANSAYNQPLDNWDVSKVEDMASMFSRNSSFNQSLNSWDISNVKNTSFMFRATAFNQPLDNWNVSDVNNMQRMFDGASVFNQNISNWSVDNVINCTGFSDNSVLISSNKPSFTNCTE